MDKKLDWKKVLRYLGGESTLEEKLEMAEWMKSDAVNEEFMQFLQTIWQMEPNKKKKIDAESAWERFSEKYDFDKDPELFSSESVTVQKSQKPLVHRQSKRKSMNGYGLIGVAASIIIAVLISLHFIDETGMNEEISTNSEIEYRELRTEKGQRTRINLTDGSIIHLNGDSYLRIPEAFRPGEDRLVYLEGEAFFEITRGDNITFKVVAGETVTTVLGTRFNISSYWEDDDVTVVVADGIVSFGYLNEPAIEPAILTNNQKGVIVMGDTPKISNVPDLSVYHGWTTGELIFEQEPLPKMISKLERWFGIDIEIYDEAGGLLNKQITASFSERQPAEDVLQSISLVLDLSIERTDTSSNAYKLINKQQ